MRRSTATGCAALGVPPYFEILLVVALGKPAESVVLEDGVAPEGRPYRATTKACTMYPNGP